MRPRLSKLLPVILPLLGLVSVASHAAQRVAPSGQRVAPSGQRVAPSGQRVAPSALGAPSSSFAKLEELWLRATGAAPLGGDDLSRLEAWLAPVPEGSSGGGVIELDEIPAAGAAAGARQRRLLPVVSLDPALSQRLHARAALLELLLTQLQRYDDRDAPAGRAEEIARLGNTAHLELFAAHGFFYVEGETREQKCLAYQRALEHARHLGWSTAGKASPPVRAGWEPLLDAASAFFAGPFEDQIPAVLCELRPVVRKAEVESRLRARVDEKIASRVALEIDATLRSLAAKQREYAAALAASSVDVPTRELFRLTRAVEDAFALHVFVATDALLLEHTSTATPPTPSLLDSLRAKHKQLDDIQRGATALDETVAEAGRRLARHRELLSRIVLALRAIAGTPGLEPELKARLGGACGAIPGELTAASFEAFAQALDGCLEQVSLAHEALRGRKVNEPSEARFAEALSELSDSYITQVNR